MAAQNKKLIEFCTLVKQGAAHELSIVFLSGFLCFGVAILELPMRQLPGTAGFISVAMSFMMWILTRFNLSKEKLEEMLKLLVTEEEKSLVQSTLRKNSGKFRVCDIDGLLRHLNEVSERAHKEYIERVVGSYDK